MTDEQLATIPLHGLHDVVEAVQAADRELELWEAHLRRVRTSLEAPGLDEDLRRVKAVECDLFDALYVLRDAYTGALRRQLPPASEDLALGQAGDPPF